jgi:hypothetical protein
MAKKSHQKDLLKELRRGVRLNTPAPKRETPKNVYSRKDKHKRRYKDTSFPFSCSPVYGAACF